MDATSNRKDEHLELCHTLNVNSEISAGWDSVQLPHCALPEINFSDVHTESEFLGQKFSAPFLISSMTGGTPSGERVNKTLAEFAQARNIPMGVGSQRIQLEKRDEKLFELRKVAPKACLYANIGIVQLNYGVKTSDLLFLIEKLEAQALILHANVLQESIQKEGDRNFSNLLTKIPELKKELLIPIILKETGCGLDAATCKRALEAGFNALDIAGMGGTHWGFIEGLRDEKRKPLGELFRNWGLPTAQALTGARAAVGAGVPMIASGGIRSGLDAAKAIFCGAQMAGIALPFLKLAEKGPEALNEYLDTQVEALKIAMFCTATSNCKELNQLGGRR